MMSEDKVTQLRPKVPCPECGQPSEQDTFPFCSRRCKNLDLNRWLSGAYVLPPAEDDEKPNPDQH
jgi:endogenous inhibitor of DNA gyrase (YacG/DUF329 family)